MRFYTSASLYSNQVLERGFENGQRFNERIDYEPTLYVPTSKSSKWKTLDGRNVDAVKPGTIKDCREFINQYKDIDNFGIYGNTIYQYSYLAERYPSNPTEYDFSLIQVAYIDIETGSENGFPSPLTAIEDVIAITVAIDGQYYVWGCGDFENSNPDVTYFQCSDEAHLLSDFLEKWHLMAPDILTGWNVQMFDVPYLVNRIRKVLGDKQARLLSPWKIINERVVTAMRFQGGNDVTFYDLVGCTTLDYFDLYKKFTYSNQESYRLDYIASIELGERKLSYEEYDGLHDLYKKNFQRFIEYNIKDVQLVERLEDKMKLMEMACALAYDAKVNYVDVFTQVRLWDVLIYNYLRQKHIVIPPKKDAEKSKAYTGAHVKDPITGMHKWVVSFDLNSLYPHLIMQYNISPETILDGQRLSSTVDTFLDRQVDTSDLKDQDVSIAASGQMFRKDVHGFLPQMMQERYQNRTVYKKKMLAAKQELENEKDPKKRFELEKKVSQNHNLQLAMKISMNSAYGALGNQYFRFYDERLAEAITLGGQLSIRWAEKAVNKHLNKVLNTVDHDYVIASDTDSLYVTLEKLVNKVFPENPDTSKVINFMDKVCEQDLQKVIDNAYNELKDYLNAYDQKMFMKRECLADKGIWTGKKHYLLNVYDNEGVRYAKPSLKVMGIEAVKSSTPTACRAKLKEAFDLIMSTDEATVQKFIKDFRKEFEESPIEDIAFPRSVKNIGKYTDNFNLYQKATPIHVRGTILHNHYLRKFKLTNKYPLIQEGEKIKFVYLTSPNPIKENVIAMMNGLPKEFKLEPYIDYETQFNKSFRDPLADILKTIGWSPEHINTLSAFFV